MKHGGQGGCALLLTPTCRYSELAFDIKKLHTCNFLISKADERTHIKEGGELYGYIWNNAN